MNTSWNHDGLLCLLTISDSNILRNSSTQPVGMSLAELRSTMNGEPDTKLFHFSAIAFVLVFVIREVRKRRSKMFEVADNSVIGRRKSNTSVGSPCLNGASGLVSGSVSAIAPRFETQD